jgi:glutathione S-transferase
VPTSYAERQKLLPPPHTVPVLLWDGQVVNGTDQICAFLDRLIPQPPLYPQGANDDIVSIEKRCGELYWFNSWLSIIDPAGFERYAGEFVRSEARKKSLLATCLLAVAPKGGTALIGKTFLVGGIKEVLERRGGAVGARLARTKPKDAAAVFQEAHAELRQLEVLLAASPTLWFCGAETPTGADLTLYAMLERWIGDMWMPGRHGGAQPRIIDGLPKMRAAFDELRRRFLPRCNLENLPKETYRDLETLPK